VCNFVGTHLNVTVWIAAHYQSHLIICVCVMLKSVVCLLGVVSAVKASWNHSYLNQRAFLLEQNIDLAYTGVHHHLPSSVELDQWLQQQIDSIYIAGDIVGKPFVTPGLKERIEQTELFQVIDQNMPKGAILHLHESSCGSLDWVIGHALYNYDELYVYWNLDDESDLQSGTLKFFKNYSLVPEGYFKAQELNATVESFEVKLQSLYTAKGEGWTSFGAIFKRIDALIHYLPSYLEFLSDAFTRMISNGILHIELRTDSMSFFKDLDGNLVDQEIAAKSIINLCQNFEDKLSVRFIAYAFRYAPETTEEEELRKAFELKAMFPNYFIGFDLVGMEDTATTLSALELFLKTKPDLEKEFGFEMPLYLHDGESSNPGDSNLVDALLLNSKRVGHGLNLVYYPLIEKILVDKRIAVEVAPLSNHILGYIADLRFHPAAGYLRRGVPMTLSSDDPMLFGYSGMSHDFFQAIVSWRLRGQDVVMLLQNSIEFSAIDRHDKKRLFAKLEQQWMTFLAQF
jgi:adenosine deaminase CECR1